MNDAPMLSSACMLFSYKEKSKKSHTNYLLSKAGEWMDISIHKKIIGIEFQFAVSGDVNSR